MKYSKMMMNTTIAIIILIVVNRLSAQQPVYPTLVGQAVGFAISGPLSNNPVVSYTDFPAEEMPINGAIDPNILPPDYRYLPTDPEQQLQQGAVLRSLTNNFAGQSSNYYPPDANGDVNNSYYFQTVNNTYAIFDKSDGSIVAGPSPLNSVFDSSLPGAEFNNGDPIVLWDEQAGRWFFAEFSLGTPPTYPENDYMLIAVSQTDDPTGLWYSWSFDVDDWPDYPKFGIWQDGYYMGTNTHYGNDVYVFDRNAMLAGDPSPTFIAFDNPNRPNTYDNIHCILPLDNDGLWAPAGTPGQFITIADDDQGNPEDALYIFELHADWATPENSTFTRTQVINVNPFSGNFNSSWANIPQPGTSQKLCGVSQVLMHRAQYRNFNGTQKIVCAHTIAESENESAIRWYELENTGSGWSIVQQSTYNPDNVSRWMPSIAMNDLGDIAMGYSVSDGISTYPGIRFCGHTHAASLNVMDVEETIIWDGNYSQIGSTRWGDYAAISVDPDGSTFWFTSEYKDNTSYGKGTRIAAFSLLGNVALANRHNGDPNSNLGGTLSLDNLVNDDFDYFDVVSDSDPVPVNTGDQYDVRTNDPTLQGEKHLNWNENSADHLLEKSNFEMTNDIVRDGLNANFDFQDPVTITTTIPQGDVVELHDPWYLENPEADPENWVQPDTLLPVSQQGDGSGNVQVFLNQNFLFNDTDSIYSLKAPQFYATTDGIYEFVEWSGVDGEVMFDPNGAYTTTALETDVVFLSPGATVTAEYTQVNNIPNSTTTIASGETLTIPQNADIAFAAGFTIDVFGELTIDNAEFLFENNGSINIHGGY